MTTTKDTTKRQPRKGARASRKTTERHTSKAMKQAEDHAAVLKAARVLADPSTPGEFAGRLMDEILHFTSSTDLYIYHPALVERALTFSFESMDKPIRGKFARSRTEGRQRCYETIHALLAEIPNAERSSLGNERAAAPNVVDDFKAPEVGPGTIGATYEDNHRNYAHVRECAERIAQKLEAEDTPELVREVLESYLSDLGAQYFRYPRAVRAAYEAVCLAVSRPPFPLPPLPNGGKDYTGDVVELLNHDPERSLAEARRLQKHGFLRGR